MSRWFSVSHVSISLVINSDELNWLKPITQRRTAWGSLSFLEKVFLFLMGYSKKLYNVLGGYKTIIADLYLMVNTKLAQILQNQVQLFVNYLQITLQTLLL